MPSKLIIASFTAGIVVGTTVMGAIGLRNSSAQTAEQPGPWQLAVFRALPIAFRLNTNTGALEECSNPPAVNPPARRCRHQNQTEVPILAGVPQVLFGLLRFAGRCHGRYRAVVYRTRRRRD
jgi:hypothetical protein